MLPVDSPIPPMKNKLFLYLIILLVSSQVFAQEELMQMLEEESRNETAEDETYVTATFKGTRLINGHSVETRSKGNLDFIISHRFGTLDRGIQDFFGLDFAQIRLGLEYSLFDQLTVGVGRSSFNKVYDAFGKYRILRQSDKIPVTVTGLVSSTIRTDEFFSNRSDYESIQRLSYTGQLLIARKLNSKLSLQLMPTIIHRNYVEFADDVNDIISVGVGGRYKITNRLTINAEYFPVLNQDLQGVFYDALAVGVDIETGGHVFQLHFTNAQQMNEPGFIGQTTGDFFDGNIHFGFNVVRAFSLGIKN